jgi:hypothetical protein
MSESSFTNNAPPCHDKSHASTSPIEHTTVKKLQKIKRLTSCLCRDFNRGQTCTQFPHRDHNVCHCHKEILSLRPLNTPPAYAIAYAGQRKAILFTKWKCRVVNIRSGLGLFCVTLKRKNQRTTL